MCPHRKSEFVCLVLRILCLISLFVAVVEVHAARSWADELTTGKYNPLRNRPGLRNAPGSDALTENELAYVLMTLKEKTGWDSLRFDEHGYLVCPAPNVFTRGSAAARHLLQDAISGRKLFQFEAHNHVPDVTFGCLAASVEYVLAPEVSVRARPVKIDFADFKTLRGDNEARQAFDLGLVILHELGHGVWELHDARSEEEEPGECETFVNRIRRELDLPERETYAARVRSYAMNCRWKLLELRFVKTEIVAGKTRTKHYRLLWHSQADGPTHIGFPNCQDSPHQRPKGSLSQTFERRSVAATVTP